MAEFVDDYEFIINNLEKYEDKVELQNIVYSNHELSLLCKIETHVNYLNRPSDLFCTKPFKRDNFLERFREVSTEYLKTIYESLQNLEVANQISREYEGFIDKMSQKDDQIALVNGEDLKYDCLARHFVWLMKMLGFIVKRKPRKENITFQYTDVFVQLMFVKAYGYEDRYFYLIYSMQPWSENGFEMVVLDDFIFKSIIQILIKNIEVFSNINCTYNKNDIIFPQCFKVVFFVYTNLWNFLTHLSMKCKDFIQL